jgi:hypothetical protein
VILLSSALILGILHGLGADHLMAIAALSVGPGGEAPAVKRARAFGVAVRFAIGHALLLAIGAGALIALGWSLPIVVERGGEVLGGMLLVGLGGVGLWGVTAGRVYGHTHTHGHETDPHWHLHIGRRDRHPMPGAHSHLPTVIGAAFAVSSLRALTLLTPFGDRLRRSDDDVARHTPRPRRRRRDGGRVHRARGLLDRAGLGEIVNGQGSMSGN